MEVMRQTDRQTDTDLIFGKMVSQRSQLLFDNYLSRRKKEDEVEADMSSCC